MSGGIPALLKSHGYVVPVKSDNYRVFTMTQGPEKCGKTDWALRHAPGPIAVASTDTGTKDLVDKHIAESGKEIYLWQGKVPPSGLSDTVYKKAWQEFLEQHEAVLGTKAIRTYVWDTATEVWDLARLAAFGKLTQVKPHHYVALNAEFRDLIKTMYGSRPDLNFVAVHKIKKQYVQKGDKDAWNGKYERSGFDDFRYLVDVCLEHYYDQGFGIRVMPNNGVGARQSADLVDLELEGDDCSFFYLAMNLFPEVEPEHWWDGCPNHPLAD